MRLSTDQAGQLFVRKTGFLLNYPQQGWMVESGSLHLFMTRLNENFSPEGRRHYLFTVEANEILLGHADYGHGLGRWGILAVPLTEVTLKEWDVKDIGDAIAQAPSPFNPQLEGWIDHIDRWFQAHLSQVEEGIWLESIANLRSLMTTETLDVARNSDLLLTALSRMHQDFYACWHQIAEQVQTQGQEQFQQRQRGNEHAAETALGSLAALIKSAPVYSSAEDNPLLVAAGAVAHSLNLTLKLPKQKTEKSPQKLLRAIARASNFRVRKVLLEEHWWKQGYCPMVAYRDEGNSPVALIPGDKTPYLLYDPATNRRLPVNAKVAATLESHADLFYLPLPHKIQNFFQLFWFGLQGHTTDLFFILGLGLSASLLGMVTPQVMSILVDSAIPGANRTLLIQMGLGLLAANLGSIFFQLAQSMLVLRVENIADNRLQTALWDRLLQLPAKFFRHYTSGDLLTRLFVVHQIRSQLSGATQSNLLSGLVACMNLALMLYYSPLLALIGVGIAVINIIAIVIANKATDELQRKTMGLAGEMSGLTVQLINGVSKLRVAVAEERAFRAWASLYTPMSKARSAVNQVGRIISVFDTVISQVSMMLIYGFAFLLLQKASPTEGIQIGSFIAFNSAFGTFLGGIVMLTSTLIGLTKLIYMWERAQPIFKEVPEDSTTKADPGPLAGRIRVDRLNFKYDEDGLPILDDVSFYAEPGEFIAIVGPSGSGKSTLLRLLLGFEQAESGTISFDNYSLASLSVQAVRRQLGVVLQSGKLNAGSIFDNITAGRIATLEEAWVAIQRAGLTDDIAQMPMGLHTIVSEGGGNLSGGQRQRLMIARALVHKPKIILMDEATSALDNRTQAIVTESLDHLKVTRIVIAHRLSTIRHADRIYVMEAGKVKQVGNFDELSQQDGLFSRLIARQIE
jgi:NHLM bacteriocin system ABC transporter ATP-binding protein